MTLAIFAFIAIFLVMVDTSQTVKRCSGNSASIIFVLDSSSSVWVEDYRRQLKFVTKLVDSFDIKPNGNSVQVGVITFSSRANLDISLNKFTTKEYLKTAISAIPYRGGTTNTAKALILLRKEMQTVLEKRSGPFIAIIVTDGHSRQPNATANKAKQLHQLGIDVYAIGVGKEYSLEELKVLASDPDENVYEVNNYHALENFSQRLDIKTCNDMPIPPTATTSTVSKATEPMLRDETSAVCFGYDVLSIGSFRGNLINQFIRLLLPYTGYGAFEIISLPYCPQTFSVPFTPIHSETNSNTTNVASFKSVSNLEAVISKISRMIQSKLVLNNRNYFHFTIIIYFDSSVNIITPNIIEEIGKLRNLNCKIYLVNIGYTLPPQHLILKSLNCHIFQVPTYEDMLNKARNTPLYFRPMLNLPLPNIHN